MTITSRHVSYIMSGGLAVLILAIIGSAYLANVMLSSQAKKLSDLKVTDAVLSEEKQSLAKAKKDTAKYTPLETIARTVVPQDKDQAQTIREIVKLAADSGITPSSITFPASSLGSKALSAAPVAGATPVVSSGSNLTQLTPVKSDPGLYVFPITVSQDASSPVAYSQFISFLGRLEQNRRTALVSGIILQPSAKDRSQLSFTLTLNEYIKP